MITAVFTEGDLRTGEVGFTAVGMAQDGLIDGGESCCSSGERLPGGSLIPGGDFGGSIASMRRMHASDFR